MRGGNEVKNDNYEDGLKKRNEFIDEDELLKELQPEEDTDYYDSVSPDELGHGLRINEEYAYEGAWLPEKEPLGAGRIIRRILLAVFLVLLLLAIILTAFLTANEFKPGQKVKVAVSHDATKELAREQEFSLLTWDIGYGVFGQNASYKPDGGDDTRTANEAEVGNYMTGILKQLQKMDPDVALLQEVDKDSTRSYRTNESSIIFKALPDMQGAFTNDWLCRFVPHPLLGRVDAGIQTMSKFPISSAQRRAFPVPNHWPLSTIRPKRGMLVTRIPLKDTDRELVVVNVHLQPYEEQSESAAQQINRLKRVLEDEVTGGNYVICGGNFNQTFSTTYTDQFMNLPDVWQPDILEEEEFNYGLQLLMDSGVATARSLSMNYKENKDKDFQFYVIDGFILSSNINVKKITTKDLGFLYSNHNPVVMTLELEE